MSSSCICTAFLAALVEVIVSGDVLAQSKLPFPWPATKQKAAVPEPPKFPFNSKEAARYQRAYATWAGFPLEFKIEAWLTFA